MAKHWIRDVALARGVNTYTGYMPETWLVIYHMLRCAGWKWVWECDGSRGIALGVGQNHVDDGSMEAATTGAYTGVGVTLSKDTTEVREGYQSLKIVGSGGGTDEVTTDPIDIRVPQVTNYANIAGTAPNMSILKNTNNDDFNEKMIGVQFVLTGCDDPNNDGTFTVTAVTPTGVDGPIFYQNASGVADSVNGSASWFFKVPVHIAMWVKKANGDTWDIDVDRGDGSPVTVGSFTGTGDWELIHLDFNVQGTGNITITIKPDSTSTETVYVDSIMCFRSLYEFADYEDHADGDTGALLENGDEFSSSNYTFTAGDVGKFVFIFDASGNHVKNTGVYEILSVAAGVATLDLRSTTFQFEDQDGSVDALNWRMVDVYKWASSEGSESSPGNTVESYCGFCLESPHSSGWRFTMRGIFPQQANNGLVLYAAPTDVGLNKDTGFFYPTGISLHSGADGLDTFQDKNYAANGTIVSYPNINNMQWMSGRAGDENYTTRVSAIFDDGGKYLFFMAHPGSIEAQACLIGLVSQDEYHPGSEAFVLLSCRNDGSANNNLSGGTTRGFTGWIWSTPYWGTTGVGIGTDGLPKRIGLGLFSLGVATDYPIELTQAQANPFDGEEWLRPLIILRDPLGVRASPSERDTADEGIYSGRMNIPDFTVFGSDDGDGDGVDDGFNLSGTTITYTDNDETWSSLVVGHEITITGATTPGNNGTFVITGRPAANQLTWENASGATELFSGDWKINMARFLHVIDGLCIDWPEEYLS